MLVDTCQLCDRLHHATYLHLIVEFVLKNVSLMSAKALGCQTPTACLLTSNYSSSSRFVDRLECQGERLVSCKTIQIGLMVKQLDPMALVSPSIERSIIHQVVLDYMVPLALTTDLTVRPRLAIFCARQEEG